MTDLPFPEPLATLSAQAAARTFELHRGRPPCEYVVSDLACYRLRCGRTEICENLYRPRYPYTATPGLGVVRFIQVVLRGDKADYAIKIMGFKTKDELQYRTFEVSNPGIIKHVLRCYENARGLPQGVTQGARVSIDQLF